MSASASNEPRPGHGGPRYRAVLVSLLGLGIALMGCGESGVPPESHQPTAASSLDAALLGPDDLSRGWEEEALIPTEFCGVDPLGRAVADSATRLAKDLGDIQQTIAVFPDESSAAEAYALLSSPRSDACFRSTVQEEIADYSGGDILKPLKVLKADRPGDRVQTTEMKVTVESSIGPAEIYIDRVLSRRGRAVSVVKISSGLQFISGQLLRRVVEASTQGASRVGVGAVLDGRGA